MLDGCEYELEDHCTLGCINEGMKESELCNHEDKSTRFFDCIGTGLCQVTDKDLVMVCPDCNRLIDECEDKGCVYEEDGT